MSALAQRLEDVVLSHSQDVAALALQHVVEVIRLSDEHEVCWVVHMGLRHGVPDTVSREDARVFGEDVALDLFEMRVANRPVGSLLVLGDEECHEEVVVLDRTIKKSIDDLALGTLQLP